MDPKTTQPAFESWMASSNYPQIADVTLAKLPDGSYKSQLTFAGWQGWQGGVRFASKGWTLADLRNATIQRQAEWCTNPNEPPDLSFRAMELGGEAGECADAFEAAMMLVGLHRSVGRTLNVAKKIERERHDWRGSRATKEDLAAELADVVICVDLMALTAGIDLMSAVRDKFNATSEKVGLSTKLAAQVPSQHNATCRHEEVGNSIIGWCPHCTTPEEILRRALFALTLQISELMAASTGATLKPDIDAGALAAAGGLLKWDDATRSCWLGGYGSALAALKQCGVPQGMDGVLNLEPAKP
jgi:NTP pyrophosphatase (non-canonical NTP hydrolase)